MKVASFYRFLDLPDVQSFRDRLQAVCDEREVLGTILVAGEGFNGTICGLRRKSPRSGGRTSCRTGRPARTFRPGSGTR